MKVSFHPEVETEFDGADEEFSLVVFLFALQQDLRTHVDVAVPPPPMGARELRDRAN